jgi:hypothetical protein
MTLLPIVLTLLTTAPEPFHLNVRAGASFGVTNAVGASGDLRELRALNLELGTALSGWTLGLGADLGATLFGHDEVALVAYAGRRFALTGWLTPEVGLEAGAHRWSGLGGELLVSAAGDTTALLPQLGVRAALHLRIPIRDAGLLLSVQGRARTDLGRTSATPEVSVLGGPASRETIAVGGQTLLGGLMLGLEL